MQRFLLIKWKGVNNITTSIVKGAPGHYQIGVGVLDELERLLADLKVERIHIVSGKKAWHAVYPYLPEKIMQKTNSNFTYIEGDCTLHIVEEIASQLTFNSTDAIIGIGGGTALDIAKASAVSAGIKSILIPTIASTCAAWTPLSVFYDEDGTFTHYTEFPLANTLVLVEPTIIAKSPLCYLKAGIGDTLAKFYEADALIDSFYKNSELPVWLQVSQFSAAICKDVLLKHGKSALDAVSAGTVSDELVSVIEAIIMTGGMVGGFGGKAGRVAGAHSIHNGLTEAQEVKDFLHGELVAYGTLIQLAIEEKDDEILKLIDYYHEVGLPIKLKNLAIDLNNQPLLNRIIKKAILPQESIHFMSKEITEETLLNAIQKIEQIYQL